MAWTGNDRGLLKLAQICSHQRAGKCATPGNRAVARPSGAPELRSLCNEFVNSLAVKLLTSNVTEDAFMRFTDESGIGLDETDHVSAWILRLAVGMMVLGAVFATLDWYEFLPPSPATQVSHLAAN